VIDEHGKVSTWQEVAPWSSGFVSASLDDEDVLTITTFANWFYGKGVYRYAIGVDSIVALDEGQFDRFADEELAVPPPFLPRDPALEDVLKGMEAQRGSL
jgi:hypothetical protein